MPHSQFSNFYSNSIIQELAQSPRWTVSNNKKMPIDIRHLVDTGRVRGAFEKNATCLMTLDELTQSLPNAANHAFALNTSLDQVMILDIEKTCPSEIAHELLQIPALYTETSMSGKGYHLVLPLPSNYDQFPIAHQKRVLKEKHGWYEILIDHWITFTRNPIPNEVTIGAGTGRTWEEVFAELAGVATETQREKVDIELEKPNIPGETLALQIMTRDPLPKTVADFHGDNSRFEFSVLSTLHFRLRPLLPILESMHQTPYTNSMIAWLMFEAAKLVIEPRDKHSEYRNQMPLLLNAASDLLARREADRQQETNPQDES